MFLCGSVSKTVQLDVVELLKQVLQWTPLYKPGLNRALIQAAKVSSNGCVKVTSCAMNTLSRCRGFSTLKVINTHSIFKWH